MKIIVNQFFIYLALFSIIISLSNCASFSYEFQNPVFLTPSFLTSENVKELNGEYSIIARSKDSAMNNYNSSFNNFFQILDRNRGSKKDTLNRNNLNNFSFKINVINDTNIKIEYLVNSKKFNEKIIEYELRAGYLYLNNKNTMIGGVPYIFGGIEVNKVRLTRDLNGNLVAEIAHHNSGAILLVFGDAKDNHYQCYYHKVK
ncbi:hypothetical protein [Aquimarina algicola]|uniref:Uncharacterized protein n=1 Tax=Aquimarina algicola TaxID=2589995 RepID=A0A504J928_9FLAO|nr:hypothetical protein [Aquimarina algicola]TPN84378.1 hypothetical protein FHK87_15690 [Aquimarina algicola]